MQAPIVVTRGSAVPLHRQIYDEWRTGILNRRFAPGERVPSSRDLAASLAVSRATVTAAYDQLIAEGYLESERGSGTFVTRDLPDEALRPSHAAKGGGGTAPAVRLSAYGKRLGPVVRRTTRAPGIIDLSQPHPDVEHFPFRLWAGCSCGICASSPRRSSTMPSTKQDTNGSGARSPTT